MFEISQQRELMLKMLNNYLDKKAKFSCLTDGLIEYHLKLDNEKYVITIAADDNFINKMSVEWLLDIKRVTYFSVSRIISDVTIEEIEFNINHLN